MLLPTSVNRAALRAFWLFLSLALGGLAAVAIPVFGVSGALPRTGAAAALAGMVALPGLLRPYSVWPVYRAWNWLARQLAGYATRYVTAICFFMVVRALGRGTAPPRFEVSSSEPSMWKARSTQSPDMYASLYHDAISTPGCSWTSPLRGWMRSSGHSRARGLLLFIWLVHVLDAGQPKPATVSRHIYTLY